MPAIAWAFSRNRKAVRWRTVIWATALQLVFAVLVIKTPPGQEFFGQMNSLINKLLSFQEEGGKFVFGNLALGPGQEGSLGFFFAFQVLTTIIFMASLMSVLYYVGVMQKVVKFFAWIMEKTCVVSGAEALCAAANIFMGQTEAPILVRPYIEEMTESELLCIMVAGFATISAGVLTAYVGLLRPYFPDVAGHLIAKSVMSAPAALLMAKLMVPETASPKTMGKLDISYQDTSVNVIESAANGASTGLQMALNVGTMLVAFMALIAMLNAIVRWMTGSVGLPPTGIENMLGYLFAPVSWLMGVPWKDCAVIGQFIGEKTLLNEFVAYVHMTDFLRANPGALSPRSIVIGSYAVCGFGNFMSIAIMIGGIGAMAPTRRKDLARLGILALVASSLATFMTAAIAGLLVN
ncbi:MAG: NupC/NupG family nucleoside CNT transporter [Elusimicrobia bacterium]|nr:NupC/NupG family nucleoside CNT transporter [Elusimicrobiota bacterium]